MDEIQKELKEQREILEKILRSAERTRKAFTWALIISIVVIVLPLIGLVFVLPSFMNTLAGYSSVLQ